MALQLSHHDPRTGQQQPQNHPRRATAHHHAARAFPVRHAIEYPSGGLIATKWAVPPVPNTACRTCDRGRTLDRPS